MSDPVVDKEALLELVDNDPEFLDVLIKTFLDDCTSYMESIREAVEKGDAEAVVREAHGLKGAVANLQARPAEEAARRLEDLGRAGSLDEALGALEELEEKVGRLITILKQIRRNQ